MSNEIVAAAAEGKFRLSRLGIEFNGDVPEGTAEMLLREAGSFARGCLFIIGDTINYAQSKWGEKYDRWIALTGLEYQTLAHAASIARKIEFCRRRQNLTFEHHKLIAPLALDEQERWLALSEQEGLSVRRLRKSLALGRPATDEDMEGDPNERGIENVHPFVNRICGFWGRLVDAGWVKDAGIEKLRAFKRDLQPVVDIYNKLPS